MVIGLNCTASTELFRPCNSVLCVGCSNTFMLLPKNDYLETETRVGVLTQRVMSRNKHWCICLAKGSRKFKIIIYE